MLRPELHETIRGSFGLGVVATLVGTPFAIAGFASVVTLVALRHVPRRSLIDPRLGLADGDLARPTGAASSGP